jgi:hypothetical protein
LGAPAPGQAAITWRVSVKVLLNTTNGWPTSTNSFNLCSRDRITALIDEYNRKLFEAAGWGFRLQLTEILEVRGSSMFDADPGTKDAWTVFQNIVSLYRPDYFYDPNAINFYISHSSGRGVTYSGPSIAPLVGNIILLGKEPAWSTLVHEFGHAMDLCHTHGCCNNCAECNNSSQDDKIGDTIRDSACWSTTNQVALDNFNKTYAVLNADQRRQVDFIMNNIMSYHIENNGTNRTLLTHDQWDHLVDISNYQRFNVASGRTWFVDAGNHCGLPGQLQEWLDKGLVVFGDIPFPNPFNWGTRNSVGEEFSLLGVHFVFCMGGPDRKLADGVKRALQGDRLQIRAGNYNEKLRIDKKLSLVADRGTVVIGR